MDTITNLDLIKYALAETLDFPHTTVNVGFIEVAVKEGLDPATFIEFLRQRTQPGAGTFLDLSLDGLDYGPSYIDLGAWLGSQQDALIVMGIGAHLGAWDIVSPATLGVDDPEQARTMMGSGFLMIAGIKPEFRALVEA